MAFLILLFLVLLLAEKPVAAEQNAVCNSQFLVTATNTESGVEVRVFPPSGKSYERKDITRQLSPECGEDYFRCGEPLVVDYTAPSTEQEPRHLEHVVILPLTKAIGLLKLKLNSNSMLYVSDDYMIDLSQKNCSPTTVYHISNAFYVVCLNTENNFLTVLELRLNATVLAESYVRDERDQFPHLNAVSNVTNFVYVYLYEHFIFFATGYEMFAFKPLSYTFQSWEVELKKWNCYVMSLAYIGDGEMLAFCRNKQAVYIDLNSETTFSSVNYTIDGQPFVCPNPDVFLSIHTAAKYVEYGLRSSREVKNFEIPMLQFDNGICLGAPNRTLFAYTDRDTGVHLLEVPEGTLTTLSTTSCINYPCQRLVLLGDRYLVIREKRGASWFITVFDSAKENISAVIEVPHAQADLMGVVQTVVPCRDPSSNGTNQQQATKHSSKSNSNRSIVIIAVCATSTVAIFVGVLVVIVIVCCVCCKRKRMKDRTLQPVQEKKKSTTTTLFVPGNGAAKGDEELEMSGQPAHKQSSPESDSSNGALRETEELAHSQGLPLSEKRAEAEVKKKKSKYREKSPEADQLLNN